MPVTVTVTVTNTDTDREPDWTETFDLADFDEREGYGRLIREVEVGVQQRAGLKIIKAIVPGRSQSSTLAGHHSYDAVNETVERADSVVAGYACYVNGYIELTKVDPFTDFEYGRRQLAEAGMGVEHVTSSSVRARTEAAEAEVQHDVGDDRDREAKHSIPIDNTGEIVVERTLKLSRQTAAHGYEDARQFYIRAIRGKKHVYVQRLVVHSAYRGMGIEQALIRHITDEADGEKIVSWLFSRPVVESLCFENGFVMVGSTEVSGIGNGDERSSESELCVAMLRMPLPVSK